ncbi:TIGR04076 family protein [Treponema primitia]|uniref:TIGR04076 family protein n=1 Tax=Treponema primitia TaxID=88058 RepID=UPI0002554F29|nr:TIGR04076 family protein [Treponema primitia]
MEINKAELDQLVKSAIGNGHDSFKVEKPVFVDDSSIGTAQSLIGKVTPPPLKKFKITVERVEGTCVARHKVGETFYLEADKTPGGVCIPAFAGLLPYINAMICNANFWWEPTKGKIRLGCPDPDNHVTFSIEVIG